MPIVVGRKVVLPKHRLLLLHGKSFGAAKPAVKRECGATDFTRLVKATAAPATVSGAADA